MRDWLERRVHYLLPAHATLSSLFRSDGGDYQEENPQEIEVKILFSGKANDDHSDQIMMVNVGSLVYNYGKKNSHLFWGKIGGVGEIAVSSPRVGILEIGKGMFKLTQ